MRYGRDLWLNSHAEQSRWASSWVSGSPAHKPVIVAVIRCQKFLDRCANGLAPACNTKHDRDINAVINIEHRVITELMVIRSVALHDRINEVNKVVFWSLLRIKNMSLCYLQTK